MTLGCPDSVGIGVQFALESVSRFRRNCCPVWVGIRTQPVQHRQHRRCLERRAVITVQHRLGGECGNLLSQRRAVHQMRSMIGVVAVVHLPADNFAAIQVQNDVAKSNELTTQIV